MANSEFIKYIAPLAQEDMKESGILASITIAQACLESAYGTSELAVNARNLFGMKCVLSGNTWASAWDGVSAYQKRTQEQDGTGKAYYITASFRSYPDVMASIKDHSLYLTQARKRKELRYEGLAGEKDYRKAAAIIKSGGYATDVQYVSKLCNVIETWGLTQYDNEETNKEDKTLRICLDAGHYGKYNQSPCNRAYYESDMVWKLHLLQKEYLEEYGVEVVLTRTSQATDRELYSRGAASAGCSLFISDHSNAAESQSVDYPVAYCGINRSADLIGRSLAECIQNVMGTRQQARIEHRSGNHGDYYGVLRGAAAVGTPALILEHSFHTNPEATAWLLNDANLDRLAKAEVEVITAHYGLTKAQPTQKYTVGWCQDEHGWWYADTTDTYLKSCWQIINGHKYYFNADGYALKDWQQIDGNWYYFEPRAGHPLECALYVSDADGVQDVGSF